SEGVGIETSATTGLARGPPIPSTSCHQIIARIFIADNPTHNKNTFTECPPGKYTKKAERRLAPR
ncbi:MAG: hypothetical protein Q4C34_06855, partial [Bacteroidales bacterium]|nr:hypothetical protein [Bacteroidales bacterium]